ncbi:hypothetical protein WJX72_012261 [[Myrmecia] bisecta]|uniref:F-box domain-containing protein n=1 Tax=[Myrmecia] bisecta TaxID=41462 RepID=A0AAW1QUB9_9CHLO
MARAHRLNLANLPDAILGEIFKRVTFRNRLQDLPLVCSKFERLLRNPPISDLWGEITLNFSSLKTEADGSVSKAALLHTAQWLSYRSPGIPSIRLEACAPDASMSAQLDSFMALLAGSLLSGSHSPVLRLYAEGAANTILDMEIFRRSEFAELLQRSLGWDVVSLFHMSRVDMQLKRDCSQGVRRCVPEFRWLREQEFAEVHWYEFTYEYDK